MKKLSVEEIKNIFMSIQKSQIEENRILNSFIFSKTGIKISEPVSDPSHDVVMDKIFHRFAVCFEKGEDVFNHFIDSMADEVSLILKNSDLYEEFEEKDSGLLDMFMGGVIDNLKKEFLGITSINISPYNMQCLRLDLICKIAEEHNIEAPVVMGIQKMRDQVTKSLYTKEEYALLIKAGNDKMFNVDFFKKTIMEPMFNAFRADNKIDEEELAEMWNDFEAQVVPEIENLIKTLTPVIEDHQKETLERIYG